MLRDRLLLGVPIGLVAAAATAGTLIGFGWVREAPFQPLNAVAHLLMGSRAFYVTDAHVLVTSAGVLVHVLSVALWGILFALASARAGALMTWVLALMFAAVVALVDFVLLPERFSPGFESILTRVEVAVVYAVMAVAMGAVATRTKGATRDRGPRIEEATWKAPGA